MDFPSEFFYDYPQYNAYSIVDKPIQAIDNSICVSCSSDDENDSDLDSENSQPVEEKGPITMGQKYTVKYNMDYTHTYCCNFCNYWTRKQSTMCMHYAIKHRTAIEKTSKYKEPSHKRKGELFTSYDCPYCKTETSFPVKSQLQQHIKNHHTKQNQFICPYEDCRREFKQKGSLICHVARNHMPQSSLYYYDNDTFFKKQYVCISCKKRFTRNAIAYHVGKCSPLSLYQL